jgi:hypothetical protein
VTWSHRRSGWSSRIYHNDSEQLRARPDVKRRHLAQGACQIGISRRAPASRLIEQILYLVHIVVAMAIPDATQHTADPSFRLGPNGKMPGRSPGHLNRCCESTTAKWSGRKPACFLPDQPTVPGWLSLLVPKKRCRRARGRLPDLHCGWDQVPN